MSTGEVNKQQIKYINNIDQKQIFEDYLNTSRIYQKKTTQATTNQLSFQDSPEISNKNKISFQDSQSASTPYKKNRGGNFKQSQFQAAIFQDQLKKKFQTSQQVVFQESISSQEKQTPQKNFHRSITPSIATKNFKIDQSKETLKFINPWTPEIDQNLDKFKSYRKKSLKPLNYSDQMIQNLAIKHYEAGKRIQKMAIIKNEANQLPKDQLQMYEMGNAGVLNYKSKFGDLGFVVTPIQELYQVRNAGQRKQNILEQFQGRSVVGVVSQQEEVEQSGKDDIKKEVIEAQKSLNSIAKIDVKKVFQKKVEKCKYLLDSNPSVVIKMLDNLIEQNQKIDKSELFQGNIEGPKDQNKDMIFQPNIVSQNHSLQFTQQAYPKEIGEFVRRRFKYIQQKNFSPSDHFFQKVGTSIKDCQLHSIPQLQQTLEQTQKIYLKNPPIKISPPSEPVLKCTHVDLKDSLVDQCVLQYKNIVRWIVMNSFQLRRHKGKEQIINILKKNDFFDMQNLSEEEAKIFQNPDACVKIFTDPLLHIVKKDIRLLEKEELSKGQIAPQTETIINQDRQPTSFSVIQKERGTLKQTGFWREILQFLTTLSPQDAQDDLSQNHFLKAYFDEAQVIQPNGLIDSSKQTVNQLKEQIFQKKKVIQQITSAQKIEEQNDQLQSFHEDEDLREKRVSFPFLISSQANQYVKELAQYFQEQNIIKDYKIQKCFSNAILYNPQYTADESQQQKLICLSILSIEKIDIFCNQLQQQLEDFYEKFIIKKTKDNSDDDGDIENDFVRRKITKGKYPNAMRGQRKGRTIDQGHIYYQGQQDEVFERQFSFKQLFEQRVIKQEFWQLSKTYLNDFHIQNGDFGQNPHVNKHPLLMELLQMFDKANQKPSTLFLDLIDNKKLIIGPGVFRDIDIDVLCKYIIEIQKLCPKETIQIFETRDTKFKNNQLLKILSTLQQTPRLQKLLLHKQFIQRQEIQLIFQILQKPRPNCLQELSFSGGAHFYSDDLKDLFKLLQTESNLQKLTLKDYPFFINQNEAFNQFGEFISKVSTFNYLKFQLPIEQIRQPLRFLDLTNCSLVLYQVEQVFVSLLDNQTLEGLVLRGNVINRPVAFGKHRERLFQDQGEFVEYYVMPLKIAMQNYLESEGCALKYLDMSYMLEQPQQVSDNFALEKKEVVVIETEKLVQEVEEAQVEQNQTDVDTPEEQKIEKPNKPDETQNNWIYLKLNLFHEHIFTPLSSQLLQFSKCLEQINLEGNMIQPSEQINPHKPFKILQVPKKTKTYSKLIDYQVNKIIQSEQKGNEMRQNFKKVQDYVIPTKQITQVIKKPTNLKGFELLYGQKDNSSEGILLFPLWQYPKDHFDWKQLSSPSINSGNEIFNEFKHITFFLNIYEQNGIEQIRDYKKVQDPNLIQQVIQAINCPEVAYPVVIGSITGWVGVQMISTEVYTLGLIKDCLFDKDLLECKDGLNWQSLDNFFRRLHDGDTYEIWQKKVQRDYQLENPTEIQKLINPQELPQSYQKILKKVMKNCDQILNFAINEIYYEEANQSVQLFLPQSERKDSYVAQVKIGRTGREQIIFVVVPHMGIYMHSFCF